MPINCSQLAVNFTCDFDLHVQTSIQEKQDQLDAISVQLSEDAALLRKLREQMDPKKSVDISLMHDDIAKFKAHYEQIQNQLSEELRQPFDFDALNLSKISPDVLQNLVDRVEFSKMQLQNKIQPLMMELESVIQLMKLLSEICKHIVSQQTESIRNWVNRAK
jgi:hypothetical protein